MSADFIRMQQNAHCNMHRGMPTCPHAVDLLLIEPKLHVTPSASCLIALTEAAGITPL
jgi:hypothetical protein